MTEITYKDGIVTISQYGVSEIRFRTCDLDFNSRKELMRASAEVARWFDARGVGYLKTQPVEERQKALEEALGVSFPCGTGDYDE